MGGWTRRGRAGGWGGVGRRRAGWGVGVVMVVGLVVWPRLDDLALDGAERRTGASEPEGAARLQVSGVDTDELDVAAHVLQERADLVKHLHHRFVT